MERHFIDCKRIRPPAPIARALDLKGVEGAILVRRTLLQDGRPVVFDEIWLPALMFKGLTAERLTDNIGPMYGMFETEFGVRMIRAEEKIRAVAADAAAEVLAVAPGTPLLSVERLSFTYGDKPVELRRGLYRTDSHHYRNTLS
jgi:GntR family transcriptional regulator